MDLALQLDLLPISGLVIVAINVKVTGGEKLISTSIQSITTHGWLKATICLIHLTLPLMIGVSLIS